MNDLSSRLEDARQHLDLEWTEARAKSVLGGMMRRRQRRAVRTIAATALLVAFATFVALRSWQPGPGPDDPAPTRLADGLSIDPEAGSDLRIVSASPSALEVELRAGVAAFSDVAREHTVVVTVAPPGAPVSIEGRDFLVGRHGTELAVTARSAGARVTWSGQTTVLASGEQVVVPVMIHDLLGDTKPTDVASGSGATPAERRERAAEPRSPSRVRNRQAWRALAEEARFDDAYASLQAEGQDAVDDDVGDLLLVADVARLSGHPRDAVAPLTHIVDRAPDDPRAALAAFTLGRILLDLGDPRAAATAFARVPSLDPADTLVEDALAREVEAWSRAGELDTARGRAEEYVRRYPSGLHGHAVQSFGGLP